ncbi:MAG: sigma-70 family RNA polymerase sigma factor [Firmicutes bacterium]|nr:sigma-70 family RNA polymerase sigma factor [Bacillota bacterium]
MRLLIKEQMNYRDYNDFELLSYISEKNEEASEVLFEKYRPLINATANRLYYYCKNTGLELNDLIQEGMLGLNLAMTTFNENKETTFYTYAKTCIERKIISLVVSSRRLKHKFLNESLSFEINDEVSQSFIHEKNLEDNSYNPEEILVNSESLEELIKTVSSHLTDFEIQVFELKLNGFDYKEIAEILDKDTKSIDNALQRIKTKIKKIRG